jgi:fluoride exporter
MLTALYIAMAGALGTLSRYLVSAGAGRLLGPRYPYGTFAVNVIGSFALGFAMALFISRGHLDSHLRMALTIGFLGGFTTYSSFAYETVTLVEGQRLAAAAGYVALTLIVAALACYAGMAAGRALR